MSFTLAEIKKRAFEFAREHADDADEKSQAQTFWRDFFEVWGIPAKRLGVFEARAKTLSGNTGFVDFFWPGMLVVEHKSRGHDLDKALKQALDYCATGGIANEELPRYIVVSDFARFRLVDLEAGEGAPPTEFPLSALHENIHLFGFILGWEKRTYRDEDPVNIRAAELMGAIHDDLLASGFAGHELEVFLVRLMFCLFADDTGIFAKDHLMYYLEDKTRDDGSDLGMHLAQIFQVLNTAPERRQSSLDDDLKAFPYVNGGLFDEALTIPSFTGPMRATLLHVCRFNWAKVSPAIFGSLFQSVMDAGARRHLGAHYTSEKNILKTIHPLFLDDLLAELEHSRSSETGLNALLAKIRRIKLLDPACGCGNFLILAYRELRLLEIEAHKAIQKLTKHKYADLGFYHGIDVNNLYGIEIEEFPAQIARVALWIMDHLMNVRLGEEFGEYLPRMPLTASPKIVHGNALRLDWADVVDPSELSYLLGNPPFVGSKMQNEAQRTDVEFAMGHVANSGTLDFVATWYVKAADYLQGTKIGCAFVSTNSISQGEQVGILWSYLLGRGVVIHFAHRTFKWSNEAKGNAAVYCVIVGFGLGERPTKRIFDYPDIRGQAVERPAKNINPYLIDSRNVLIGNRSTPLCEVPSMGIGNKPIDGGNYLFSDDEKADFLAKEPQAEPYFKMWLGSDEFLNGWHRWVLWLGDCAPQVLRAMPESLKRVDAVRNSRLASKSSPTQKLATTPTRFHVENFPTSTYLVVPKVSSERRPFLPIGFMTPDVVCSDLVQLVPNATLFHFGVLQSTQHMAWMRQVCGRLEGRYRYSNSIVYNNFPWPACTPGHYDGTGSFAKGKTPGLNDEVVEPGFRGVPGEGVAEDAPAAEARGRLSPPDPKVLAVEKAAQGVLDARALYPASSLADLYDPLTMPPELVKAHQALDKAVDKCYRAAPFASELERVEFLFGLYEQYTAGLLASGRKTRKA